MPPKSTLVWFRGKDLRVTDHTPLWEAARRGPVVLVFVVDPHFFTPGRAAELPHRMQFLLESLASLQGNLEARHARLFLLGGRSLDTIPEVARRLGVSEVLAQRWTEPMGRTRDRAIEERLDVPFTLFEGETLLPPETLRNREGKPFSVYTPFARAARAELPLGRPLPAPTKLETRDVEAELRPWLVPLPTLDSLGLKKSPELLPGGEKAARKRLAHFIRERLPAYATARDGLVLDGTSRLSADLKFGTLSVRSVWTALEPLPRSEGRERFEAELLWREFAYHNLWDRPGLLRTTFRADFRHFPYRSDTSDFAAWSTGQTGYPVVDAAARQLLREGYVHNRARMISASFLTKHLLIDYKWGEAHYLKYLTDGDLASNNLGWQWSAGSGVDAAPYFRVFNPVTQGKKFDPDGNYVRRYVPELKGLPTRYIHAPWLAPPAERLRAGVRLGENYPNPRIDAAEGRQRFLDAAGGRSRALGPLETPETAETP
jgi:deoxyribodipyrimidine photo-lyase